MYESGANFQHVILIAGLAIVGIGFRKYYSTTPSTAAFT
jgi:hypothetical protein